VSATLSGGMSQCCFARRDSVRLIQWLGFDKQWSRLARIPGAPDRDHG
jgi:hypothetical protein